MKTKKGDTIIVISGKDKGKKGKILQVLPENNRIVVEGINLRKKHVRPRRQGEKGQTIEMSLPFQASNVKVVCTKCKKPTRIGYKLLKNGKKYRICKKCGQEQ
ncbi:MAG: 50S ribosomal protein L24 [Parcubacteria group bacterium GW2011_GWC1_38_6]|nr:MAG: 50S ribosomal protein L24 [Parcubacteria group bacterium GW2011_GWA1_36_12]KKQ77319.1 MAG: 50S ribosomal protein L24 [Parcubacteria group bacterium GW2011_GWC1_38_6]